MITAIQYKKTTFGYRVFSTFVAFTFIFSSIIPPRLAQAQSVLNLPAPGAMVQLSPAFVPVLLKGMTIYPDDPLKFDFIIDSGNTNFAPDEIKIESERLVRYFLAAMTVPKDDLWVNLSPYENDRIIPEELGRTELGRDMLAQDYILKQLTASLMYPEEELGKEFWDKIYQKAKEQFGTLEIPVNTFNKVWILPERATVYEHEQTVYIVDAHFKVMLDSDYQAMQYEMGNEDERWKGKDRFSNLNLQSSIIKEIIIPEIEREVNEGKQFVPLRQIYHSLILAKWYKETVKNSLLSQVYVDQNKVAGINIEDATIKDQIYAQYIEAYKKGVFNYIREDYDRLSQKIIPRKYFSGGITGDVEVERTNSPVQDSKTLNIATFKIVPQEYALSSSPLSETSMEETKKDLVLVLKELIKEISSVNSNMSDYEGTVRSITKGDLTHIFTNQISYFKVALQIVIEQIEQEKIVKLEKIESKIIFQYIKEAKERLLKSKNLSGHQEIIDKFKRIVDSSQIVPSAEKLQSYIDQYKSLFKSKGDSDPPESVSSPIDEQSEGVGGIDLNEIDVNRQGSGVNIQFDPVEVQQIIDAGVAGFAPVFINLTPLPSVLPLLGFAPQKEEKEVKVSSLN